MANILSDMICSVNVEASIIGRTSEPHPLPQKVRPPLRWQGEQPPDLIAERQLTLFLQSVELLFSFYAFLHGAFSQ